MLGYLKRRFSSDDLHDEDTNQNEQDGLPSFLNPFNAASQQTKINPQTNVPPNRMQQRPTSTEPSITNTNVGTRSKISYPSAPTSPTRSASGFTSAPIVESITDQITNTISRGIFAPVAKPTINKAKCKILLIIDEPHIDWSKYFRGRKIFGDWDLRIEQAEFREICLVSYSEYGCTVDVQVDKSGTKTMRSFKPDFLVVRQSTCDANENWKNFLIGFLYGGVPSLNSMHALFNMHERPWMYAHLELVRNRLGEENFPLIKQVYYPSHREMVVPTKFPMVIKIGNCRNGKGKIKIENHFDFQDVTSIVAVANTFATSEPFIDAKCDVVIQKIGNNYKAFLRKSLSGSWKTNTGSAILEQIPMTEKFKLWITEVAKLFGGLDICSLKAVQSKDDDFHIYEVKGSNMNLLGETQEEDRKLISELIWSKMQIFCRPNIPKAESLHVMNRQNEQPLSQPLPMSGTTPSNANPSTQTGNRPNPQSSASGWTHDYTIPPTTSLNFVPQSSTAMTSRNQNAMENVNKPNIGFNSALPISSLSSNNINSNILGSLSGMNSIENQRLTETSANSQENPNPISGINQNMNIRPNMGPPKPATQPTRPSISPRQSSMKSNTSIDDGDDTMKNLRKTFAGIFGDM